VIGDKDPEDAYDAGDPPEERLRVIGNIVAHLRDFEQDEERKDRRIVDALRLISDLERVHGVDMIRLAELRDELEAM
jgi:Fe-S-cluster formation regulator IscX/YfhJ